MDTYGRVRVNPNAMTSVLMVVSCQLHALAILPLGKPLKPINWEAGWIPEPVWTGW